MRHLGSILLSGCRAPQVYRDFPQGSPTGYLVDPRYCTRCGDCLRVCRCGAVGGYTFSGGDKEREALETAREHFVARLAEGDDVHAERALRYLDAALAQGTALAAARHPLRSFARR